jgi:hypothetical protein
VNENCESEIEELTCGSKQNGGTSEGNLLKQSSIVEIRKGVENRETTLVCKETHKLACRHARQLMNQSFFRKEERTMHCEK